MGQHKKKKDIQKSSGMDRSRIIFVICIICVVFYRIIILADYATRYVDDDQALVWYETVAAAHFDLKEPHFMGQAYGSNLEAVAATPLYLLGIPINVAASLGVFILWFAPFVICALMLLKKKPFASCLMLALPLLFSWRYDVLTADRSFVSGFSLAFLGIMFLQGEKKISKFFAPVFMMLGFIVTETSATVSALGVLYYILYQREQIKKDWIVFLTALPVCIVSYLYCNVIFYKMNPDYNLHGGVSSFSFSVEVFGSNLNRLFKLLSAFSVLSFGMLPWLFMLIVIALFILGWIKDKRLFILQSSAVIGSLLFFALPKTMDYVEELLFSQERMFLYIPYVLLLVSMYYAQNIKWKEIEECKWKDIAICIVCVVLTIGKTAYFESNVLRNPELYRCSIVSVWNVDDIRYVAGECAAHAEETDCDELVFLNGAKAMIYGSSAINYDKYISYIASYDRRTDIYLRLKNDIRDRNVLFWFIDSDGTLKSNVEFVSGESLIDYIRHQYDMQRYLSADERYIAD